ncbi:MAG: hypothetical protein ABH828_01365 [archaeon]
MKGKALLLLVMLFSLFLIQISSVNAACTTGIYICGVSYNCVDPAPLDGVCVSDFPAWTSCSSDNCADSDQDCCKSPWTWFANSCCGDDGESFKTETQGTDASSLFDDGTQQCCSSSTNCVEASACKNTATTFGSKPTWGYCDSGTWKGGDASTAACSALVGNGKWSLGGIANCCGDDNNELVVTESGGTDAPSGYNDGISTCCSAANACTYNDVCTSTTGTSAPAIPNKAYCNAGTWQGGDTGSTQCAAITGASNRWSINGETAQITCCGDDNNENRKVSTFNVASMDGSSDGSDACCLASTDCVDSNTCYNTGLLTYNADGDVDNDYCNAGTWYDCQNNNQCDISTGYHCVSNDCTNTCTANAQCPNNFFCNSGGICTPTLTDRSTCVGQTFEGTQVSENEACQSTYCDNDGVGLTDDNWCFTPVGNYDNQDNNCEESANSALNNNADERRNNCTGTSGYVDNTCNYFNDGDSNQQTCECILGTSPTYWAIGGETSAATCCDDATENRRTAQYHVSMTGASDGSDACCLAANDCVDNNVCYNHGTNTHDADGDSDSDYCNQGVWQECDTSSFDITKAFVIKNNNVTIAAIDKGGIFKLKRDYFESTLPNPPSTPDYFDIRDSDNNLIAYVEEDGDLYLGGFLTQNVTPTRTASKEVVVRYSGTDVAIFNEFGDLTIAKCISTFDVDI